MSQAIRLVLMVVVICLEKIPHGFMGTLISISNVGLREMN
jgi:hypothetical protein